MEKKVRTRINDMPYFLNKDSSAAIIDENDIKNQAKINIQSVSKFFDTKPGFSYMKNLISNNLGFNNMTILVLNLDNSDSKRNISLDMAVTAAAFNKKVLLFTMGSVRHRKYTQSDIDSVKLRILNTSIKNLDLFTNSFPFSATNEIVSELKGFYDIIIMDLGSFIQFYKSLNMLTVIDYTTLVVNSGETKIKDLKKVYNSIKNSYIDVIFNKNNETQILNLESKQYKNEPNNSLYAINNSLKEEIEDEQYKNIIQNAQEEINDEYEQEIENVVQLQSEIITQNIVESKYTVKRIKEENRKQEKIVKENINRVNNKIQELENNLKEKINREEYEEKIEAIKNEIQEKYDNQLEEAKNEIQQKYDQQIEEVNNKLQQKEEQQLEKEEKYKIEQQKIKEELENYKKKIKQKEKKKSKILDIIMVKQLYNKQNKHIKKLKKDILELTEKLENSRNIEVIVKTQREIMEQNILNNMKREKDNEKIAEEYKKEIEEIKEAIQKDKREFALDEEISYEDLERNALYIIPNT